MRSSISLLLLIIAGCGDGRSTVGGNVTVNGTPAVYGKIAFHPTAGGPISYGSITDGAYVIKTGSNTGLMAGEYKVTAMVQDPPIHTPGAPVPTIGKTLSSAEYATKDTTPLTANVKPGSNKIDFDLTGNAP